MQVVLNDFGQAVVFDRVTGETHTVPVPTALENVERGRGRFVHGTTGERMTDPEPAPEPADEPAVALQGEDLLALPQGETGILDGEPAEAAEAAPEPEVEAAPVPRPRPRPKARPRAKK